MTAVIGAAPVAAPRPRSTGSLPSPSGEFASLLAGLGGAPGAATPQVQRTGTPDERRSGAPEARVPGASEPTTADAAPADPSATSVVDPALAAMTAALLARAGTADAPVATSASTAPPADGVPALPGAGQPAHGSTGLPVPAGAAPGDRTAPAAGLTAGALPGSAPPGSAEAADAAAGLVPPPSAGPTAPTAPTADAQVSGPAVPHVVVPAGTAGPATDGASSLLLPGGAPDSAPVLAAVPEAPTTTELPADGELLTPSAGATAADPGSTRTDAAPAPGTSGLEQGLAPAPTTDVRTAAAPPAAPAPPPPPPAAQVVSLLGPVLEGPDGAYSLSLELYPEELGTVQVEVLLRGGEIRLALHAADPAAQSALRAAVPDLRADLQSTGLAATSVSVDGGRSEQPPSDRSPRRPAPHLPQAGPSSTSAPSVRPATSTSDAALDLRM